MVAIGERRWATWVRYPRSQKPHPFDKRRACPEPAEGAGSLAKYARRVGQAPLRYFYFFLLHREQAEDGNAVGSAYVHLAIGDCGSHELVAEAELIVVVEGLVAVVKLLQVRVVGVQHRRIRVLNRPDDSIGVEVRGDAGSGSGVLERRRRLSDGSGKKSRILELKRQHGPGHRAVVDASVVNRGHGPDSAGQDVSKLLVNVVGLGIVLAQVGAVDDVHIGVFARANGELPDFSGGILGRDQHSAAGAKVKILTVFPYLIEHLEIVCDLETAGIGEP